MTDRTLREIAAMSGGVLTDSVQAARDGAAGAPTVTDVVTDSRQAGQGSLFVAVVGERTDGHRHVPAAAAQGAVAALVSDVDAVRSAMAEAGRDPDSLPLVVVPDTVEALGGLARAHLARLREQAAERGQTLSVVAMTGSVGKTTTKDLTRQVLAAQAPTVAPVASFNNEIGLPLTVLRAQPTTRYLVLEMGASGPGHIDYLTSIAPLDAAAVLMIGHAHMGGFRSVDGVARAKSEIVTGLLPTGVAVLNLDDPRAAAMRELAPGRVLTFSADGDPAADLRACDVELDEQAHAVLDLHLPGAQPQRLRLGLPGRHNVANALAAAGLCLAAGLEPSHVVQGLAGAGMESPHRMDVCERGSLLVVDDSYNANIDSMTAALQALPSLAGDRRRVVIISEMLELGSASQADHARTGELVAAAGAQVLVTIGQGAAPAAQAAGQAGVRTIELPDVQSAIELLDSDQSPLRPRDAVLVKGSNGSGAWRVADHLTATDKED
ncbi:UDP-N-acetylmuramoyl-tripeptide--D-alanyl-D-alanine ligase [Actinomyces faecalis]|uniref:UDP-N-acetylmuramoyl-tripeptide--D-alanyl-D- alanine ligase n=1 Tax=Actinomyces faecalis TaxID=2722820 RepID=UPI0015574A36|nr:UDP-N-acetylmuramoyl-tripeptide--D-alanyl-D-alanine ligase [Actinomyces faecalis]